MVERMLGKKSPPTEDEKYEWTWLSVSLKVYIENRSFVIPTCTFFVPSC
jgi:hypothetical protein